MHQGPQGSLPILLVDDDPQLLLTARLVIEHSGYTDTVSFTDGREALEFLEKNGASLIVLDLMMPEMSGIDALLRIEERFPHVPVIIMTGKNEVETAVQCMKSGAFDYLVKPIDRDRFIATIRRAFEMASLRREVTSLKNQLLSGEPSNAGAFSSIVTHSKKMLNLFQYIEVLAGTAQPVLIMGETGVGKELFARTIHAVSGLKGPFIAVNVAGLDDTVFSDTLFGHVRGAFTGADKDREGLIAKASGGTLLLDEIGEINIASQLKLLRLLQEGDYYPLGSDTPKKSTARILSTGAYSGMTSTSACGGIRSPLPPLGSAWRIFRFSSTGFSKRRHRP
jgi:DNA-binding NtrC family response regulator